MNRSILRELEELVQNNIIDDDIAQTIKAYYKKKEEPSSNRLLIVFSVLGALLTGLGIILIIAHNWDDLNKTVKLSFALLPMLIGQMACGYVVFTRQTEKWKKEASATFLFFSIAASISIVSQVYNIEGSLSGFLLTWMILAWPVVYVMRSSMTSLLYIGGITWYACTLSYFQYPNQPAWWYWPLLMVIIPYYYSLSKSTGNFFHFHSWFIGLSLVISLGTVAEYNAILMYIAYFSLLSGFVSLGQLRPYCDQRLISNAFLIIGSLGVIGMLLSLSFEWFWNELSTRRFEDITTSPEFIASVILTLSAGYLLYRCLQNKSLLDLNLKSFSFLIFIALFLVGLNLPGEAQVLINILIFLFAVFTMINGARQDRLTILNYGLLILTALIACRFFDTNMSFVLRGLLFVFVGVGFFTANYYMIRKRKQTTT